MRELLDQIFQNHVSEGDYNIMKCGAVIVFYVCAIPVNCSTYLYCCTYLKRGSSIAPSSFVFSRSSRTSRRM